MTPLYNCDGEVVAWQEGRLLRDRDGKCRFWIDGEGNVFDYDAEYRGVWDHDHWRAIDGGVVVFREGATDMPVSMPFELQPTEPEPMPEPEPMLRPGAMPDKRPPVREKWSDYEPFR